MAASNSSCQPVFVLNSQLPGFDNKAFTTAEICSSAEKVCGYNSIDGAQRIGGLWRIYPRENSSRQKMLLNGIVLRGVAVTVKGRNPYLIRDINNPDQIGDRESFQPPTTKLIIGNIPLSFSDDELLQAVKEQGVNIFSKLISERDRDENGKLTHWKTGRRFVYIAVPLTPLPNKVTIGPFSASFYHKEQKTALRQEQAECRRCLTKGHKASECLAPIKCRQCLKEGHKAGDSQCGFTPSTELMTSDTLSQTSDQHRQGKEDSCQGPDTASAANNMKQKKTDETSKRANDTSQERSRPRARQKQTQLTQYRREASGSVKRARSTSQSQAGSKTRKTRAQDPSGEEKEEEDNGDMGEEDTNGD